MKPGPAPPAKSTLQKLLRTLLLLPVIVVLLFEEWGWEPLARCFKALAKLPLWSAVERRIENLPPWAALMVFAIPVLALIPIKLLALYLMGNGFLALGVGLVIAAKITGTALAARLFQLTEPALMRLHWFARLYVPWKIWKDRILEQVRNSELWRRIKALKAHCKATATRSWQVLKTRVSNYVD